MNDTPDRNRPRALIQLTPAAARRLRDPRVVAGVLCALAGAIAVLAGYWGVSGTLNPGKQLPYIISGGIGGVFLLGLGAALVFSSDLAATRREVSELKQLIADIHEQLVEQQPPNGTTRRRARARTTERS